MEWRATTGLPDGHGAHGGGSTGEEKPVAHERDHPIRVVPCLATDQFDAPPRCVRRWRSSRAVKQPTALITYDRTMKPASYVYGTTSSTPGIVEFASMMQAMLLPWELPRAGGQQQQ